MSSPRRFDKTTALYERALKSIPLASQTFSKSVMSTVEGAAPLFLERGEGARVWDVDGNTSLDYVLGLLPVVLGYRDPDVDAAIRAQLDKGISFSLATPLEAELAERLVQIIPCAEMVRFGKNGSDATTAAIRLARAHTGRDKIAICRSHLPSTTPTRSKRCSSASRMISPRSSLSRSGLSRRSRVSCKACARYATATAWCWCSTRSSPAFASISVARRLSMA
jgi:glutamate-1-semialdehyde aminotransferase